MNALDSSLKSVIAYTKEELSGEISRIQTELNTKIDNNTSTLNSLVSEVSSNLSSFQTSTNASIGRIDANITTIDSSINSLETHMGEIDLTVASLGSLVTELKTRVETAETTVERIGEDVSTQEQVMAGAIVDMRSDYRTQIETLHNNPNIWAPNGTYGTSATRSVAPIGDEVRGLSYVETETGNRTIDLTTLFETEQGQPADVDLRSIYDSALFVAKGPVQVRVDTTFREDTDDSLVLYYDFIDATAVKRQVIEIGNNDDAVLTVLMKKTVTLAKFR